MARSNIRRLSQFHSNTFGTLLMMASRSGVGFVVMALPERAAKIPKAVSGNTNVAKSLSVKSQRFTAKDGNVHGLTCK